MSIPTHKVMLVGDSGCGKTTWVQRLLTGKFEKKQLATVGVEVHPLIVEYASGSVCLNIWDVAGSERFGGLRDGYMVDAEAAIIMVSSSNPNPKKSIDSWRKILPRDVKLIVVENVFGEGEERNIAHCNINVEQCTDIHTPLQLVRLMLGYQNVK